MTSLIIEVYDAFKSVGIADDIARKAAGELPNNDRKIDQLETKVVERFGRVEADLLLLKRMVGVMFAGVASLVVRTFF